jgi:hypothetical protein
VKFASYFQLGIAMYSALFCFGVKADCTPSSNPVLPQSQSKMMHGLSSAIAISSSQSPTAVSIASELEPLVHTLDRPVLTYNYESRESYGLNLPGTGQVDRATLLHAVHNHVFGAIDWLWQNPHQRGNPSGLYVAIDPVASKDIGGDHWALTQIELPRGFRYLDLRSEISGMRRI